MNLIQLDQTESHYLLSIPNTLIDRAKKINPCEWDSTNKVWKYPRNITTYDSLINEFKRDIDNLNITPPKTLYIDREKSPSDKNKVIANQRKKIESLEHEIETRENEIDRYIATIINLNEKIDDILNLKVPQNIILRLEIYQKYLVNFDQKNYFLVVKNIV